MTTPIALVSLDSFYDNSLALSYVESFAMADPFVASCIRFESYIEPPQSNLAQVADAIASTLPMIVGFNTYVWNVQSSLAVARMLKQRIPSVTTVMGGMEATYAARSLLEDADSVVDFVVVGEGEIAFRELLRQLMQGKPIDGLIAGLGYRDASGVAIVGGLAPTIQDLDAIPSPFRGDGRRMQRVLYESYRGCAFRCAFCLYHRDYAPQRRFSLERVAADLAALRESGCHHIRFVDSTFNIPRDRAKAILRLLDGIAADVSVEVSAEFFDAEMIGMLPKAGIRHVDIGLQSTNTTTLQAVNRTWFREDPFRENLRLLRQHPALTLNVELIAGLPDDDLAGLKRSVDEAVLLWPDHVSIYRLLGLRGSDVERRRSESGLRFSETPPYELLESPTFTVETLRAVDLLTFAHMLLFNFGIGRYALRAVFDDLMMSPTAVYELFLTYVREQGLVSEDDAIRLARRYAHGNRFDRELPRQLQLDQAYALTRAFFTNLGCMRSPARQALWAELTDFGYELARLDSAETLAREDHEADAPNELEIASWCEVREYGGETAAELSRQGGISSDEEGAPITVLFTIHPLHGPAAMRVAGTVRDTVERLWRGQRRISLAEVADEDRTLFIELHELGFLVPRPTLAERALSETTLTA